MDWTWKEAWEAGPLRPSRNTHGLFIVVPMPLPAWHVGLVGLPLVTGDKKNVARHLRCIFFSHYFSFPQNCCMMWCEFVLESTSPSNYIYSARIKNLENITFYDVMNPNFNLSVATDFFHPSVNETLVPVVSLLVLMYFLYRVSFGRASGSSFFLAF